jgi:WD40 repeat protein
LIDAIQSSFFVEVGRFEPHSNWVSRLVVKPNGQQVVAALRFGSLRSWNVFDGKEATTFDWSGKTPSWGMSLARDGQRLLVGSEDQIARVFDMKTGELLSASLGPFQRPSPQDV